MASANPDTGASVYVPEGTDVPEVDEGVRLVGPGMPAEPEGPEPEPHTDPAPAERAAAAPRSAATRGRRSGG